MRIRAVEPAADTRMLLAGAQFADAFSVAIGDSTIDARRAAEIMILRQPRWVEMLMALRNRVVAPFGLKRPVRSGSPRIGVIGIFPVLSKTPERLVAGLDDSHLNFRLVVDVTGAGASRSVTATTLVLTHNLLGRIYLATILPFHRLIVRSMLQRLTTDSDLIAGWPLHADANGN